MHGCCIYMTGVMLFQADSASYTLENLVLKPSMITEKFEVRFRMAFFVLCLKCTSN